MNKFASVVFACIVGLFLSSIPALAQPTRGMHFRFVGPRVGNRVSAFAGIPGNPDVYYAGAASGGVWKSVDGGNHWFPIFDHEPVAAIGSIAVARSNPNIVWVGTGDPYPIRGGSVAGDGVYKSLDGGRIWKHMGLPNTGRIARVLINPHNSQEVYVCAEGRVTGPQQSRGVFRTTNGGKTWKRVLFVNQNTGCSGLNFNPKNPRTLFAGMWQVVMHPWGLFSGGSGSGIYVSHDGGTTWHHIVGHGLPHSPLGKIDVVVAPSNPNRVYALIETHDQGSLWRSNDGGQNWQRISWDRLLIERTPYFGTMAVSPTNDDEIFVACNSFMVSHDGGRLFKAVPWGGDNHDIWWDPTNPKRFAITFDEGIDITTTGGRGFHYVTLPVGQMYHVAVDNQVPYDLYTNMQDATTMRFPSIRLSETDPHAGSNYGMGGCESGFVLPEVSNPNIVWASCYGDEVTRWNATTNTARSVSPYLHTLDAAPDQVKYRCNWSPPLAIDPFDNNTVYYGCQYIFKTSNGGQSWSIISPDLAPGNPKHLHSSGGLIADNLGQFYDDTTFAIAPSTLQHGLIWAGTDNGKVWYTPDGGKHWHDVTANLHVPPQGEVTSIQPSFFHAGTAYLSIDYNMMDNRDPYILKTTNYGRTWTRIDSTIPRSGFSYVLDVSEDPNQPGLLFAGTGNALYDSLDDGAHWTHLKHGLPPSPVDWAVVQKKFHDLVVSTYGRGVYILDDISPLEQMARKQLDAPVRFFAPRATYDLPHSEYVYFTFALKSAPTQPVKLAIMDSKGKVIRTLTATAHAGMNRIPWSMHYSEPHQIRLRTIPPEDPHLFYESRFFARRWRHITHWGIWHISTPMAAPGKYTARLTVDGMTYTTPVTILMNPHSHATLAGLQASVKLQERILSDVDRVSAMVNKIEWMRKQLSVVEAMLNHYHDTTMLASARKMNTQMQDVEYQLMARSLAAGDAKTYLSASKIYFNLLWLDAEIGSGGGDVAGGEGYPPTDTAYKLTSQIEQKLTKATIAYNNLMQHEVPAFNRSLLDHKIMPLATTVREQN